MDLHVDIHGKIDGKEFPLASQCQRTETVITKAVPSYWYHQIVSWDATIQCNARSGILSGLATDYVGFINFYYNIYRPIE